MDVILIWADLVGPRPVIQIRAGGEFVESSIPDDGAGFEMLALYCRNNTYRKVYKTYPKRTQRGLEPKQA